MSEDIKQKYCTDCKYSRQCISLWCEHPILAPVSVHDGRPSALTCFRQRRNTPECMYLEVKLSRLQKVLQWFRTKLQ